MKHAEPRRMNTAQVEMALAWRKTIFRKLGQGNERFQPKHAQQLTPPNSLLPKGKVKKKKKRQQHNEIFLFTILGIVFPPLTPFCFQDLL